MGAALRGVEIFQEVTANRGMALPILDVGKQRGSGRRVAAAAPRRLSVGAWRRSGEGVIGRTAPAAQRAASGCRRKTRRPRRQTPAARRVRTWYGVSLVGLSLRVDSCCGLGQPTEPRGDRDSGGDSGLCSRWHEAVWAGHGGRQYTQCGRRSPKDQCHKARGRTCGDCVPRQPSFLNLRSSLSGPGKGVYPCYSRASNIGLVGFSHCHRAESNLLSLSSDLLSSRHLRDRGCRAFLTAIPPLDESHLTEYQEGIKRGFSISGSSKKSDIETCIFASRF